MAKNKFLEETGLARFWSHVKRLTVKQQGYIFIGDSYGTGFNTLDNTKTTTYMSLLPAKMGLKQGEYYTSAVTGAGFVNGGFKSQLVALNNTVTDKEFIKYIYVFGGWNDKDYEPDNITQHIDDFISTANKYYPNAQVILCMISQDRMFDARWKLLKVREAYSHYPCLSGVHNILHNPNFFTKDTYHPNQDGQNALTDGLYDAIVNGGTHQFQFESRDNIIIPNNSLVKSITFKGTPLIIKDGNTIEGWFDQTDIHFNAFDCTAGTPYLIATYDGDILFGTHHNNGLVSVPIWFNYGSKNVGSGTNAHIGAIIDFTYNSSNNKVEMYLTIQPYEFSKKYTDLNAVVIPSWHFIANTTLI